LNYQKDLQNANYQIEQRMQIEHQKDLRLIELEKQIAMIEK